MSGKKTKAKLNVVTEKQTIRIIKEVIELLEKYGIQIDDPYDLENFAQDYLCDHSLIFKTGKFKYDND